MTRSNTNYRTAMVAPTAGDSIREAHSYEYDNNGNILYAGTLRVKPDLVAQPDTVQRTREEKFRWDEDNRLTALSQNGYVSNYWYDANGDRVIKENGDNISVFVNSRQDGCVMQTGRYSVYPNPYYSYGDDGRYTKHIYIGSERVLSQVGGVYGEPRLLDVAGHDVRIKVDYPQIRASQDSVMEAAYTHFDLPYNGTDHDSFGRYPFDLPGYWNGSLQTPRDGEEDENESHPTRTQEYLYYYHTDHLGSSTLITDGNGQLVQQIEYLPYGEVFLEKQASGSTYATPYKFNGKELDEETGLYYYGARYMNPRLSVWYGCDPLQEKYPDKSSYTYCNDNPTRCIDPNGQYILFINGLRLFHAGMNQQGSLGGMKIHSSDVYNYWSTDKNSFGRKVDLVAFYKRVYNDSNVGFTSGSSGWRSQAKERYQEGVNKAKLFHKMVNEGKIRLSKGETIKIISHSQGGAHAAGFAKQLMSYKDLDDNPIYDISIMEYITPHQPEDIIHPKGPFGIQYSHPGDAVASDSPYLLPNGGTSFGRIQGINCFYGDDIFGGSGQPEKGGITGNMGGHKVTDNDEYIK